MWLGHVLHHGSLVRTVLEGRLPGKKGRGNRKRCYWAGYWRQVMRTWIIIYNLRSWHRSGQDGVDGKWKPAHRAKYNSSSEPWFCVVTNKDYQDDLLNKRFENWISAFFVLSLLCSCLSLFIVFRFASSIHTAHCRLRFPYVWIVPLGQAYVFQQSLSQLKGIFS